jgi:streptopain
MEISQFSKELDNNDPLTVNSRISEKSKEINFFGENNELYKVESVKDKNNEELFYILNYKSKDLKSDRKGFIIMSADRRAEPVLAWSDNNSFDTDVEIAPAVKLWLEFAKEVVIRAKEEKEQDKNVKAAWAYIDNYTNKRNARTTSDDWCWHPNPLICDPCPSQIRYLIGPLTENIATWGQGSSMYGYNAHMWARSCGPCGRAVTGCGAVAVGIIGRFDQKPSTGYNFSIMPTTINNNCSSLTAGENEIARFLYNLSGAMNSSNILSCQTFTLPGNIGDGFSWMGYANNGTSSSNLDNIATIMKTGSGRPVLMSGTDGPLSIDDSHYWVCDGLDDNTYWVDTTGEPSGCLAAGYIRYHINWGWNGSWNGWFRLANLKPSDSHNAFDSWLRVRIGVIP